MKKLFVSDLDGTLLKIGDALSAGVSRENRKMIHEFVAQGNVFAIASARGIDYIQAVERMLEFRPDFIGQNGTALLIGNEVTRQFLKPQFYFTLKKTVEDENIQATVILHTEKASYLEKRDAYPFGYNSTLHPEWMFEHHSSAVPDLIQEKPLGIALFVEPQYMGNVKQKLREMFSEEVEIVSSDIDLINISPKGCTKGNGVLKLMEHYGLCSENVAVIGDSENDVNMFCVTKHSYCMDHSEEAVRNKAAKTVSSVEEALIDFMKN